MSMHNPNYQGPIIDTGIVSGAEQDVLFRTMPDLSNWKIASFMKKPDENKPITNKYNYIYRFVLIDQDKQNGQIKKLKGESRFADNILTKDYVWEIITRPITCNTAFDVASRMIADLYLEALAKREAKAITEAMQTPVISGVVAGAIVEQAKPAPMRRARL